MPEVVALLTCHNRRPQTLQSLRALSKAVSGQMGLTAVVVDDGSTDGTGEAIAATFDWVRVLFRDGSRFWNGGMYDAFSEAMVAEPEFILWLNDDTVLDAGAVDALVAVYEDLRASGKEGIVAGSVRDPISAQVTYGGVSRPAPVFRPSTFSLVEPEEDPQRVDTMHGNCVLIPRSVYRTVGANDPRYTHAMGDYDYGLRASEAGFIIVLAPGTYGTCGRNIAPSDPTGSMPVRVRAQLAHLASPKGLPPKDWARFMRRWGGPLWPPFWLSPYMRAVIRAVRSAR